MPLDNVTVFYFITLCVSPFTHNQPVIHFVLTPAKNIGLHDNTTTDKIDFSDRFFLFLIGVKISRSF